MIDFHYINPRLADIYDVDSGWSEDRDFYFSLPNKKSRILDLGCGTGLLCRAYAEKEHEVTGVDPSETMMNVGKKKPNGDRVNWICSNAQEYQSNGKYDLVIMTGHAFQTLSTEEEIFDTFTNVSSYLAKNGIFVFESRNPDYNWVQEWDYQTQLETSQGLITESRKLRSFDGINMMFDLIYNFSDESLVSTSHLTFFSRDTIENILTKSGLRVLNFYGDWNRNPFRSKSSKEMIFVLENVA